MWTRLLWLHGFTGLEIMLAHCSRSAQGAGPFHYDPLSPFPFIRPYLDPPIKVKAIALPVLHIQACPTVRLGDAALAQGQRQGRPRLRLRARPRHMAQSRGGASTDGTTLEEVPQKIIKHSGFVTRPYRGRCFSYDSHTSFGAIAASTTRPRSFFLEEEK